MAYQGFALYSVDNDSYAFRAYPSLTEYQQIHQELVPDMSGESRSDVRRCAACGELLAKWDEPLDGLVIRKRQYDVSSTYDGVTVVSERFKTVYEEAGLTGLVFRQLPKDVDFFAISAPRIAEFDAERRGTRFEKQCPKCHQFESVIGATPVYLKKGETVPARGFVRTDLEFASGDEKHPLILCGATAGEILKNAKLNGLDLTPIG